MKSARQPRDVSGTGWCELFASLTKNAPWLSVQTMWDRRQERCLASSLSSETKSPLVDKSVRLHHLQRQCSSIRNRHLWQRSWTSESETTAVESDSRSTTSITTQWSLKWKQSWILNYPQVWSPGVPQKKFVSLAHDAFITAITGDLLDAGIFKSAADWYLGFLESMIRDSWVDVFRPVLNNINLKTETPSEEDIAVTFKALETIVSILKEKNLALVDIVNALYKMGALKETDGDQTHATRLVFHAVGWITLLYSPDPNTKSVGLNIMSSDEAENHSKNIPSRRPGRPRSKIISKTRQSIDLVDHPLPDLLKKFGRIMPEHDRPIFSGQITPLAPCYTRPDEWLEAPMLCFYTLHMVTSIKIEWVDCLCLHLDFDSQSKILRLFRFPSLCLVMCCNRQQCCLSQLFSDAANRNGFNGPGQDDARDYFKEVLLSYRLIFGQDRSSWPYYKLLRPSLAASVNETPDPLLDIVCGQSWESEDSRQIWNEIGAEDPADRYSLTEDFEFLSKRLMTLQRYVKGHNPSGFLSLWYDRRYPLQWWNLWAVLIIGSAALFFALLQSGLQILQLYYAKKQAECKLQ